MAAKKKNLGLVKLLGKSIAVMDKYDKTSKGILLDYDPAGFIEVSFAEATEKGLPSLWFNLEYIVAIGENVESE